METVNYFHKALHLGCCHSLRSASDSNCFEKHFMIPPINLSFLFKADTCSYNKGVKGNTPDNFNSNDQSTTGFNIQSNIQMVILTEILQEIYPF